MGRGGESPFNNIHVRFWEFVFFLNIFWEDLTSLKQWCSFVFRKQSLSAKPCVVRLVMCRVSALIKLFKAHLINETMTLWSMSLNQHFLHCLQSWTHRPDRYEHLMAHWFNISSSALKNSRVSLEKSDSIEVACISKNPDPGPPIYLQRNTRVRFTSGSCKWLCKSVTVDLVQDKVAVNLTVA